MFDRTSKVKHIRNTYQIIRRNKFRFKTLITFEILKKYTRKNVKKQLGNFNTTEWRPHTGCERPHSRFGVVGLIDRMAPAGGSGLCRLATGLKMRKKL